MADTEDLKADTAPRVEATTRNQEAETPEIELLCDAAGQSLGNGDPVELALAKALEGATAAGEWSTVAQLARELEARRMSRAGVVDLAAVRAAKNGGAK